MKPFMSVSARAEQWSSIANWKKNPIAPDHIPENELKYSDKARVRCFA
jgi:hypothetical protein